MDLHNLIKSTYTQITFKMVNYCCCFSKRADSMLDQKKLYNNFLNMYISVVQICIIGPKKSKSCDLKLKLGRLHLKLDRTIVWHKNVQMCK